MAISPSDLAAYQRDGFVLLRNVFEKSWIEKLHAGFQRDLEAPGPMSKLFAEEEDGKRFFWDTMLWPRHPEFRAFALQSTAAELAATLMRSSEARVLNDVVFHRSTGTQARSPFHQDKPYLCVDGSQVCSLWMPLVSVEAKSALAFVPGSHKSGREYVRKQFGRTLGNESETDAYLEIPDIDADPEKHGVVSWDMEPGDCVFFDALTLHGGSGQLAPDRELTAFSINWIGDDARVRIRSGGMEPDLSPICAAYGLREGDRLDCDGFPRMWPMPDEKHQNNMI